MTPTPNWASINFEPNITRRERNLYPGCVGTATSMQPGVHSITSKLKRST